MWRRQAGRDEHTPLRPGVCLTIPLGCAFQFRAEAGGEPLRVVGVTMPPWPVEDGGEARYEPGRWQPSAAALDPLDGNVVDIVGHRD